MSPDIYFFPTSETPQNQEINSISYYYTFINKSNYIINNMEKHCFKI